MTASAHLVLLSAVAAVAFVCSLLCGAGLFLGRKWLGGLAPAAQARVLLAVALAPALVSTTLLSAMVFDLALRRCDVHRCPAQGFGVSQRIEDWFRFDYCVVFRPPAVATADALR